MFDIGWSELVVIGVVALIAIGPKELPNVLRTVGNYMGKVRRMASEFQGQFQEAMREAEMADLKKQVDEMTDTAKSFTEFDPLSEVRSDIDKLAGDPLGTASGTTDAAQAASASPEAAAPATPADAVMPPPTADIAVTAEAPQPVAEAKPEAAPESASSESVRSGSGA